MFFKQKIPLGCAAAITLIVFAGAATAQASTGSLTASPNIGAAPLAVTFTAHGDFSRYFIDFGDGERSVGEIFDSNCKLAACEIKHIYQEAGTYTAKLRLSGFDGQVKDTATVVVQAGTLSASEKSGSAPLKITFTATGNFSTYGIDFGDGTKGGGAVLDGPDCTEISCTNTHTYETAGNYKVKLFGSAGDLLDTLVVHISAGTAAIKPR